MDENCVFCKIVSGKIGAERIGETNSFIAILDKNPKSEGHALIIPKQHWVTLLDIPNKFGNELIEFAKKVASDLLDKKKGDGFNLVMNNLQVAGQAVMHAHLHIIPRKEGDGLRAIA